ADAERRQAVDLYQFTSLITARYDEGQRMVLAEVMWRVVYADGELAKHESYLIRKLSNLLDLKPGYLAEARKRAVGRVD
ncbi:MAG: TerB family tellurite resistance protein, partial [Gemmatimonadales bacterium]